MNRRLVWILLIVLGSGAIILDMMPQFNTPALTNLVVFAFAIFILVSGIVNIRKKNIGNEPKQANFSWTEVYRGIAAQLDGILFVLLGLLILALLGMSLLFPGIFEKFLDSFFSHPWGWGILLTAFGGIQTVNGVTRLMAISGGYSPGPEEIVERVSSLIMLFFGLALGIVGLLLIIVPGWLAGLVKQLSFLILQLF